MIWNGWVMADHYLAPIVLCLMAGWMIVALIAIYENRALKRRIRELEAEKARGKG